MTEDEINALLDLAKTNLTAALASPKPSYEVDGVKVKWNEYLKAQRETISWCQDQLAKLPSEEITIWRDA